MLLNVPLSTIPLKEKYHQIEVNANLGIFNIKLTAAWQRLPSVDAHEAS